MAEVKIFHDREGQTLTVCVIGFEKLNFSVPESDSVHAAVETAPARIT